MFLIQFQFQFGKKIIVNNQELIILAFKGANIENLKSCAFIASRHLLIIAHSEYIRGEPDCLIIDGNFEGPAINMKEVLAPFYLKETMVFDFIH